jgi:FMN phosphatase YigB (HAD superfamily)
MQKILFDIDYTLFDTDIMRKKVEQNCIDLIGCSLQEFQKAEKAYIKKLTTAVEFTTLGFSMHLAKSLNSDSTQIHKIFTGSKIYQECSYGDVNRTIRKLHNLNYSLGIFSEGDVEFQNQKLDSLNINQYLGTWFLS